MKYVDWITELKQNLLGVSDAERNRVLDYYAEAYADRRSAGFSEGEIIEGFGAPYDAAQAILESESPGDMPERLPRPSENSAATAPVPAPAPPPPAPAPKPAPAPVQAPASAPANTTAKTTASTAAAAQNTQKKKGKKHGIIIAVAIICSVLVLGMVAFPVAIFVGRAIFKLELYEAHYTQQTDNIQNVRIGFSVGEFRTEFYDGDKIEIDYFESNAHDIVINENNNTLTFRVKVKWRLFWFNYDTPEETVIRLPRSNVYNLDVDMSAGLIEIGGGTFGNVDIDMSAGAANLNGNIVCNHLNISLSAGKVDVNTVECDSLAVNLSAGKVDITQAKCPKIDIDLSAGTVGLGVKGIKAEYSISVHKSAGTCNVGNQTGTDNNKFIRVDLSAGTVNVNFIN